MIEVKSVGTRSEWRDFILAGRPRTSLLAWNELHTLDVQSNPTFRQAYGRAFVAYQGDQPVGRIYALFDELKISHAKRAIGTLGYFSGFENPEIAASLLKPALKWLESRGAQVVQGPIDLGIWENWGGQDASWAKALRCLELARLKTFRIDLSRDFPVEYVSWVEKAKRRPAVKVTPWTEKSAGDWIPSVVKIWNESFESTPGFTPLSSERIAYRFSEGHPGLKNVLMMGVEVSGQRVGFAWVEPDWSERYAKMHPQISSRLLKWGVGGPVRRGRIRAIAVHPRVRYRIIAPLLFEQVFVAAKKRGYRELITNPLDTHSKSVLRALERFGAVVDSESTFWEKSLLP